MVYYLFKSYVQGISQPVAQVKSLHQQHTKNRKMSPLFITILSQKSSHFSKYFKKNPLGTQVSLQSVCLAITKTILSEKKKSCEDLYHVIIRTTLRQFSSPNVTCLAGRYNPSTRLFPPGRGQKIRPLRYGGKIPGPGLPYALAEVSKNSQVAVRCCNR